MRGFRSRYRRLGGHRRWGRGRGGSAGSRRRLITAGFVGGVVAGLVIWSMQMHRSRRDLFSSSPMRRLAALGHLGGQPSVETAQILSEYVRWEQQAVLRRRAERLLKRMQGSLV